MQGPGFPGSRRGAAVASCDVTARKEASHETENDQSGRVTIVTSLLLGASGCSVYMAATAPEERDLSVLKEGTPRNRVIAALGSPVLTSTKDGVTMDTFAFRQGHHRAVNTGRAFIHGAADFFTLGLWEVIGTPVEIAVRGTDMRLEVTYDESDRVKSAKRLTEGGNDADPNAGPK